MKKKWYKKISWYITHNKKNKLFITDYARNYPFISNVDRDELLKKIRDENLKTVTIAGGRREWRNTIKEGKMKVKEKKMENEARKRQENCADPHGFLRATRETVVDKRREYPAVINYETFATVGNSYKKKCTISYIFPLMPVVRAYSRAVR